MVWSIFLSGLLTVAVSSMDLIQGAQGVQRTQAAQAQARPWKLVSGLQDKADDINQSGLKLPPAEASRRQGKQPDLALSQSTGPAQPYLVAQTGHSNRIIDCTTLTEDGRFLATGSFKVVILWDVASGLELRMYNGLGSAATALAFDPRHRLLAAGSRGKVIVWNVDTSRQVKRFTTSGQVHALAFSADAHFLAAGVERNGAPGALMVWDVATGKVVHTLASRAASIRAISFNSDGKRVAAWGQGEGLQVWDHATGKLVWKTEVDAVHALAFTTDSKVLCAAHPAGGATRFTAATGEQLAPGRLKVPMQVDGNLSLDGKTFAAIDSQGRVTVWDLATAQVRHTFTDKNARRGTSGGLALGAGGRVLALCKDDGSVRLWNTADGVLLSTAAGRTASIRDAAFDPSGEHLALATAEGIRLWDLRAGAQIRILPGNQFPVFSPDGRLVAAGSDAESIVIVDAGTGNVLGRFPGAGPVVFAPSGRLIAYGGPVQDGHTIHLWDVSRRQHLRTFKGDGSRVLALTFAAEGKVLASVGGKALRSWDVETGKPLVVHETQEEWAAPAAFSPDGKLLVAGNGKVTRTGAPLAVWDVATGKRLLGLKTATAQVGVPRFRPGVKDLRAQIYLAPSGNFAAFPPDGTGWVTGPQEGTAILWGGQPGRRRKLGTLVAFADGGWGFADVQGRYDAAHGGDVEGLHWVVGNEPIALYQLKDRYYDPGLLAKYLGLNKQSLRDVQALPTLKLCPKVQLKLLQSKGLKLDVSLANQGGGIGKVVVLVNGKEATTDARPRGADSQATRLQFGYNLAGDARLAPGKANRVEVVAYNQKHDLCSRGHVILLEAPGEASVEKPHLWAVVAGVSDYATKDISLRYAAKDAEDFAKALGLGAGRLFGKDNVHLTLLTTSAAAADRQPARKNLVQALQALQKARPADLVVVYLAGHGVNHGGQDGDYFFLTQEATSANLNDAGVQTQCALSSQKLTELLKRVPAQRQVLILDTCASGRVITKLTEKRQVPASQIRALERVKDRTGSFILTGCAADAVSYEATRYAQGLLTHSLLLGMRGGALREERFVDIGKLFDFAADQVPQLAQDIGGVQRPVIATPKGGASFDIGMLDADDRKLVPLQAVRPLVLRSSFQEEDSFDDILDLARQVDEQLRTVSGRGQQAPLVFVDARDLPDAYRLQGRYKVDGERVMVELRVFQRKTKVATLTVQGTKGDLSNLAARIVQQVEKSMLTAAEK
jgi:WD40 repeat protein/uncharacterized caspase-like protein